MYAIHGEGRINEGIDVASGKIVDAVEHEIFDLFASKFLALKLATNAACTILKVDQVQLIIEIFLNILEIYRL